MHAMSCHVMVHCKDSPEGTMNMVCLRSQKRKGTEPADYISAVGKTWPGLRVCATHLTNATSYPPTTY